MPGEHRDRSRSRRPLLAALLLLGLLAALPAWGGVRDAPGKDLRIALITYGPGTIYWERFGHDAIEVRDTVSGQSINFNYGVFDFNQKDFLLNFARGRMNYMMDAEQSDPEMQWYAQQGRSVRRQVLALSPAQAAKLRDFLLWNLEPQHMHYRYDYCTTKVRDALDRVMGGDLEEQLRDRPSDFTYREQTDRLMSGQPWLMLLLDLGLSGYADRPLSVWQDAFLPMELSHAINQAQNATGATASHPLVASDTLLAPNRLPAPPARAPDLVVPMASTGLALAILLWFLGRSEHDLPQIAFGALASLWLVLTGLAGLFMLALWTLTAHRAGWANANLLLFNPLAFALLAAVWHRRVSRRAHAIAWLVAVLALLGLAANLTNLFIQQNLPWILLALPVWAVLLHVLRRRALLM
jgi:hypothetical protein